MKQEHYDLPNGTVLYVRRYRSQWQVIIAEPSDTLAGDVCIAVGSSRDEAVTDAVACLESAVAVLQAKP